MLKKFLNKLFGKPDVMSFKAGFDLTDLPVITLYQGDKKFNFLLDTGSTDSIIDSNILKEIDYKVKNAVSNLFGMEGQTKQVKSCEITLYFGNKGYTYDYLINDMSQAFEQIKDSTGVNLHGIIGSKFFNKFRYVLDFAELIAYSKK